MIFLLALAIGTLYATGVYLMLQRSILKLVIGLSLLGNGANLLIFTVGGLTRGRPPILPPASSHLPSPYADPLPQALILTAIVIGFGVTAFALVLAHLAYRNSGSEDLRELEGSDLPPSPHRKTPP